MGRAKQGLHAVAAPARRRTQALQGGNMMVVRDLLARATEWHQQYREITENAIQAVLEGPGAGQVLWKPAADLLAYGQTKLACIDQGQGMSGPNMVRFLNTLAESGRSQGIGHNHGVGAKITMMASNKEGVEVRSWVDGKGSRVLLTPDGIVELRPELAPPHRYFQPLDDDSLKPGEIDEHGTMVVLLGNSEDDDTTTLPDAAHNDGYGDKWLSKYLNSKYTRVPDAVTVGVHEKRTSRPIHGAHQWLDKTSLSHGTTEAADAKVHWWLLAEKESDDAEVRRSSVGGHALVDAHVALVSGKETYGTRKGSEGRALLREAGMLYGSGRVVLHVEPDASEWMANAERTKLFDSEGHEFDARVVLRELSESLPDELAAFVEEEAAKEAAQFDPNAAIAKGLNRHAALLHMLHKPAEGGAENGGWTTTSPGAPPQASDDVESGPHKQRSSPRPRSDTPRRQRTREPKLMLVPDIPEVVVEDDASYGAIASYDAAHNQLLFNPGSAPVRRIIEQLARERIREAHASSSPRRRKAIEDKVRGVVVEALSAGVVETVLNTRGTAQSLGWTDEQLERALSDEALSAAALQITNKMQAIQSSIGTAFGRAAQQ